MSAWCVPLVLGAFVMWQLVLISKLMENIKNVYIPAKN